MDVYYFACCSINLYIRIHKEGWFANVGLCILNHGLEANPGNKRSAAIPSILSSRLFPNMFLAVFQSCMIVVCVLCRGLLSQSVSLPVQTD